MSLHKDLLIRKYFLELLKGKVSSETLSEIKEAFGTDDIKSLIKNYLSIKKSKDGYDISFDNTFEISIDRAWENTYLKVVGRIGLKIDQNIAKEMIYELLHTKNIEFNDNELIIPDFNGNKIVVDDKEIKIIKNNHILTRMRYDARDFVYNDIIDRNGIIYRDKKYIIYADLFTDILKNEGFTEQFSEDGKYFATKTVQNDTNARIEVSIDGNKASIRVISDDIIQELMNDGTIDFSINKEGKYEYSTERELSSLDRILSLHKIIKDVKRENLSIGDMAIIYYYTHSYLDSGNIYNDKFSYKDIVDRAISNLVKVPNPLPLELFWNLAISGILKYTDDDIMIGDTPLIKTMEEDKIPAKFIANAVNTALGCCTSPLFSFAIRNGIPTSLIEKLALKGYASGELLAVEINGKPIWYNLSYEAKKKIIKFFVDNGYRGDLDIITRELEYRDIDEVIRFIATNTCNGGYPELCTRIIATYMPNILGFEKLKVVNNKIEFHDVYVKISRLGNFESEFIIIDKKDEKITKVIKAKNMREAIYKFYENSEKENATVKA